MAQAIAGDVGANTRHYLDAVDHYKDDPQYGYLFHHWVVSCQLLGPVDPEKFELALHDVAAASPVLRSYFKKEEQTWQHMIAPTIDAPFFSYKKHGPDTDWRSVIGTLTHQLNDQILPVWQTPIFKVMLQEFDDVTFVTFHIHHLMLDGWGLIVFFQQLVNAYEARLTSQASPLVKLDEVKFLQVAKQDEEQWSDPSEREARLKWWKALIGTHAYVTDPLPDPPGFMDACYGGLSPSVSKAVKDYCDNEGIHYAYVMRAAYVKMLQDWTGSEDVLLTSVKANRSKDSGEMIGNLAHWLINRHQAPRQMPLRDLARQVHKETEEAKKYYLPYWDIVEQICPHQYLCNFGITPFSFNYLPPVATESDSGGSVSLKSLFEYFEFSRRAITCEFFPRCLDSVDPETQEAIIGFDVGYNRETVTKDKTTELLAQMIEEVSEAFNA